MMRLFGAMCAGVLSFVAVWPALAGGRVLTTSDVVSIRLVDQPDLDTTTRVEPDGTVNFPYVGRIKAVGFARVVEFQILPDP